MLIVAVTQGMYIKRNIREVLVMKKILCVVSILVIAMITVACGNSSGDKNDPKSHINNNITQNVEDEGTTFEFRGMQFSVPGNDWRHDGTQSGDPIIIMYSDNTVGGFNIIGFSKPESNYHFFQQSYESGKKVETQFDESTGTKGISSDVLREEIDGHIIYTVNSAVEEKDENGLTTYDFIASVMLGENNYCDIFFFIKAENAEMYDAIKDGIIRSIKFIE